MSRPAAAIVILGTGSLATARRIQQMYPTSLIYGLAERVAGADRVYTDFGANLRQLYAQDTPIIALCAEKGSIVAVSDAGVAASLCRAALESASLNVFTNTQGMLDQAYAASLNARANTLLQKHTTEAEAISRAVFARLGA